MTEFTSIQKELSEIKELIKGFKHELKGLIEIQQRLVHERIGAPIPPSPSVEEPIKKSTKINILVTGDNCKVSGNTFDYRDTIKSVGHVKWEQETKSWVLSSSCLESLISGLESRNLVKDTDFIIKYVEITKESNEYTDEKYDVPEENGFLD